MIPPRKSSAAHAAPNHRQKLARWFVFFALVLGTVFQGQAEIGLAESPLFTIDTTYVANVGSSNSSLFTLDTRCGLGAGFKDSQWFTLDTRFSAGTDIGQSSGFTLDTLNASIADVLVTGRVTETSGLGLAGAVVQASFFNRVQASAIADASGNYVLPAIPAGIYQFRATKFNYISGVRVGQTFSAGQSVTLNFALALKPAPPATEVVSRTPIVPPPPPTTAQMKVWNGSAFVTNVVPDQNKMTIVLTHGMDSSYTNWPTDMATQLWSAPGGISTVANIVAWDWQNNASSGFFGPENASTPASRTPANGEKLGQALYQSLGATYNKPLHFIGHSLGTLVNSKSADYLHGIATPPAFPWEKTHMTLLDNAEAVNGPNSVLELVAVLSCQDFATGNLTLSLENLLIPFWISPVPGKAAWTDNYISAFGVRQSRSVNVFLAQSPVFAANTYNPVTFVENLHGYAIVWYGRTILSPSSSLLGHRYSFERLGEQTDFVTSPTYPAGSYFTQDDSLEELSLRPSTIDEKIYGPKYSLCKTAAKVTVTEVVAAVTGTAKVVGDVVVSVTEKSISAVGNVISSVAETSADLLQKFEQSIFKVASLRFQLRPRAPSSSQIHAAGVGDGININQPAYVWVTLTVPSNAVAMTFDFQLSGDGVDDCLVFGINSTNLFTLETRFILPDTELNSGVINVRPWAGTNAEFFFGVVGGTSSNASIAVDGIRFYTEVAPSLQIAASGSNVVITWPLSASEYMLESTTNLEPPTLWITMTNVSGVVDFQYTVTNSISSENRFYQLRK